MDTAPVNAAITPQSVLLILLIAVAVWAVVELALTLRKARQAVDELTHAANDTIEQVQPIIAKVDGAIDELQPTVGEVQPLVEKVELTIDEANVSLAKINGILGDVSDMSSTASSVTSSVKEATAAAANSVAGLVGRVTGGSARPSQASAALVAPVSVEDEAPEERSDVPSSGSDYITYGAGTVVAEHRGDTAAKGVPADGAAPHVADMSDLDEPAADVNPADAGDPNGDTGRIRLTPETR